MRQMTLAASVFILVWATMTESAQSMPSFAGTWTLASGSPNWGLGPEFTAAQDDRTLTVVRKPSGHKAIYRLDGSDSINAVSIGGQSVDQLSKLRWDGAKLIVTATYRAQGFDVAVTQTWLLEKSGELTIELVYVQGGERSSAKSTYKKS